MTNAKVYITVPSSWQELTDGQLYYVFNLFADSLSLAQIKTYCFFTFSKVKVKCRYGDGYLARLHKQDFYLSKTAHKRSAPTMTRTSPITL